MKPQLNMKRKAKTRKKVKKKDIKKKKK